MFRQFVPFRKTLLQKFPNEQLQAFDVYVYAARYAY